MNHLLLSFLLGYAISSNSFADPCCQPPAPFRGADQLASQVNSAVCDARTSNPDLNWTSRLNGAGLQHLKDVLSVSDGVWVAGYSLLEGEDEEQECLVFKGKKLCLGFAVKYDRNGHEKAVLPLDTSDGPVSLSSDADGNVYVVGSLGPVGPNGDRVGVLGKYTESKRLWLKKAEGATRAAGSKVVKSISGNQVVYGSFAGDSMTLDGKTIQSGSNKQGKFAAVFDGSGKTLSLRSVVFGSGRITGIMPADLAGEKLIMTGHYRREDSEIRVGESVFKLPPLPKGCDSGMFLLREGPGSSWIQTMPCADAESITQSGEDIIVSGDFSETTHLFRGKGRPTLLRSAGRSDGFIARFSGNGDLQFARSFGGPGSDMVSSVAVVQDNIYASGIIRGPMTIDSLKTQGPAEGGSAFLTRLNSLAMGNWLVGSSGHVNDNSIQEASRAIVRTDSGGKLYLVGTQGRAFNFSRDGISGSSSASRSPMPNQAGRATIWVAQFRDSSPVVAALGGCVQGQEWKAIPTALKNGRVEAASVTLKKEALAFSVTSQEDGGNFLRRETQVNMPCSDVAAVEARGSGVRLTPKPGKAFARSASEFDMDGEQARQASSEQLRDFTLNYPGESYKRDQALAQLNDWLKACAEPKPVTGCEDLSDKMKLSSGGPCESSGCRDAAKAMDLKCMFGGGGVLINTENPTSKRVRLHLSAGGSDFASITLDAGEKAQVLYCSSDTDITRRAFAIPPGRDTPPVDCYRR